LGSLPSNTVANPKGELKAITTRSGASYDGPQVPPPTSSLPKVVEINPSALMPNSKPSIPYPSRRNDERRREKTNDQIEKFYEIFKDLSFEISLTDALILMPKFASTLKALIGNKEKLSEMARTPLNEHCSAVFLNKLREKLGDPGKFLIPCDFPGMDECLALADLGASINLMPLSVWKKLSLPELTPMCMTLELVDRTISQPIGIAEDVYVKVGKFQFLADFVVEVDAFLALEDDPTSPEVDDSYYDLKGDILLLEAYLNNDPSTPPNQGNYFPEIQKELKVCEAKTDKSSIDEPLEVELKDLPPHLEYAFLEGDDKFPVIIAKDLKGINKEFYTHKILMDKDYKPAVQHQRRVNPKIHDVIKKEVEKLLDVRLIYPILDSPWVFLNLILIFSLILGFTVVENDENELIPTRLVTGWRVCIDYHKLNEATRKDHFPLPFMDQMLERLAGNDYYCFLDGFTCPYGTFAYRRMPFGLCNAPGTFQRCMLAIFHDMVEKTMEVFMDDFSVFGNSFENCLSRLDKMLKRCEDTNLCLNWEKSHFMVKEGIVLGHKISKNGIEVDKAKVDVIAKLPHPTTVKGVRSFLGHAGVVLGQRHEKHFKPIHYASKTMTEAESRYTTTEKEMLAVVYAFEKFRSYLILNKSIVYTDHSALKYLFAKKDSKARLLRWVLLLQEFDFNVIDTKGAENLAADHLSR
ncbi:reverse transcriptase domain-containing protein, partial [Tanacetum coccineum]